MKHANISVFVPHLGCPNDCSFCNQKNITGVYQEVGPDDVDKAVSIARQSKNYDRNNTEIAFFGGSFTAIDSDIMIPLLKAAYKYVADNTVCGIRISTRPDAIDRTILNLLKRYGVTAIELGAQSLDNSVLKLNDRGHTAEDVERASSLIKEYGFELGLQMMTGLYGDTDEGAVFTAKKIIAIKPDTVRIYPTIVLKNTKLELLYNRGEYKAQNVSGAVSLCANLIQMFRDADINVIRTGLHSIETDSFVAGPWHPAFAELCESERIFKKITDECNLDNCYEVFVNPADISKAIGQRRTNLQKLIDLGYKINFIKDSNVALNMLKIREVK